MLGERHADRRRARELSLEQRVLMMALAAALPGGLVALILLWTGDFTPKVQWTLTVLILGVSLGFSFALRERIILPLQTLSNLLAALREDDFSLRARAAKPGSALGDVMLEVNALVDTLRDQRLGAVDASTLLRQVMLEIDVAVFTFDDRDRLQLVNRAGERLLDRPIEQSLGRHADVLGLAEPLSADAPRVLALTLAGKLRRYEVRTSAFRQGGLPHRLLVLTDVSRSLREEERQAWQRLIRVLGHELNNSLTPIRSIAGSLEQIVARDALPEDWQVDTRRGLGIIQTRAEALGRFMNAYARLAKLPPPQLAPVALAPFVHRVAALETRVPIAVSSGPALVVDGDVDQLEQLLINLLHNAADAALETGGGIHVAWSQASGGTTSVEIDIEDEGPGLAETANLFVPFFTTKPRGSGIGLVLCRQIAEAHGGSLTLENRLGATGCVARLRLPA
ncbi:MAG: ATP-binding protein [Vicinamibacterales bacterium]|jgi:nitrogen fixation/metabolism regulation signal transduction histidine kinase|nr:ATP-binding protein [Vicinamibacterales bacterium]